MAFPDTPLGVRVDMQAGGVWTDVTSDAYTRDPITITRGQQDGASVADPSRCAVTLNNAGGKYSPRNPRSPYYGLIGRNTPMRVSVPGATPHLLVPENATARAVTPDHASLDITADLDVRADIAPSKWLDVGIGYELLTKWVGPGDQRSWHFMITGEGQLRLAWTTNGITSIEARSPRLTVPRRRYCVRATLDVDNGLGGYTATFYMAASMSGPWTQVGQTVTTAGTTSIFASTASVEVGDSAGLAFTRVERRIYSAEIRSGIGGTVVANPTFSSQAPGSAGFTDAAGRPWTYAGGGVISDRQYRIVGEVSAWPPRWAPSGQDVWTSVDVSGTLRRLGQGRKAFDSTLRRRLPSMANLLAYWPCEDGAAATRAYSPLPNGQPLTVSRWDFEQDDSLGGSSALPVISPGGTMRGTVPAPPAATAAWSICMPYRVEGTPPAVEQELLSWTTTGLVRRWRYTQSATGGTVSGYSEAGSLIVNQALALDASFWDGWIRLEFTASQAGPIVTWGIRWTWVGGSTTGITTTYGAPSLGHITQIDTSFGPGLPDLRVGHITAWSSTDAIAGAYDSADHGFTAETAGARLRRLATEEARTVALQVFNPLGSSGGTRMGPQRPETLVALLQQCADSDMGVLAEDSQSAGLIYRSRESRYNLPAALVLDYSAGEAAPPLEPVDDDQATRNDITVSRVGGSSARAVLESGPLSVQAPPLGVGLYDTSTTLSLATDDQPQQHAQWLLHLGTWDEARVPTVQIALHKHPHLIESYLGLELGDRIQITNTPDWLPPGPIDLIVQGITETLGIRTWTASLTCVPAGPWTVGVTNKTSARTDTTTTVLGTAVNADDTSMVLATTQGPPWMRSSTHPGEFPVDLQVGGEQVRATAIYDVIEDTFTRTVAGGWGTAISGQPWTILQGTAGDFSVSGGMGLQTHPAANSLHGITAPILSSDVDLVTRYTVSSVPVGDFAYLFAMARVASTQTFYMARVRITAGTGAMQLTLRKRVGGTETELAALVLTSTYTAGTAYRLRLAVQGTNLMARTWLATADEPTTWQVTATDGDLTTPDVIGLRSLLGSGVTNVPMVFAFDDIRSSPQQATVTRSVNGIVKAHAAGAAVRLHQPTTVAL
ncbi:hypothetical protein ACFCZV_13135 [Streptomyces hydrogenans]|uniref:hypothetical protein n=1 Tax=Streptomyces hydrogenans TaxID=1873719 RepID=UPI0035DB08A6